MILLLLAATQVVQRINLPIECPEKKWVYAGIPNEKLTGISPRVLILSNGPEFISDSAIPAPADHVNLYWGKIPFEGKDLKLRILIDHLIDPKSSLDNLDIRFCCGVRNGGASKVKIVRRVSTIAVTPASEPRQYINPGQGLAAAHLGQKWQINLSRGQTIDVPDDSLDGDVANIGLTLKQHPEHLQYGNLVAEVDLHSDKAVTGRSLIVRTVARKPSGTLGKMLDAVCTPPGAGERGWWPQSDIEIQSDPNDPVVVDPQSNSPYAASLKICVNGDVGWSLFNRFDTKGAPITINKSDAFGTKNSGLWGVNVLYRIYVRSGIADKVPVSSFIACAVKDWPASHVVSGPFNERDRPWEQFKTNRLRIALPGYINFRSPTDFDAIDFSHSGATDEKIHYFEYFVTNAAASMFPTRWIIRNSPK